MAVIGATVPILSCSTSELGHGDHHRVLPQISKVDPERRKRLRKISQHIGQLTLCTAFVHVMVPAADIGERDLHSEIGLNKLRQLPQAVAKTSTRIIRSRRSR